MNKKVNTVLFIIGATLLNVLVIFIIYLSSIYIFAQVYNEGMANYVEIINMVFFIGSIIISFIFYRFILKFLSKKIDMNKYFEPILSRKRK